MKLNILLSIILFSTQLLASDKLLITDTEDALKKRQQEEVVTKNLLHSFSVHKPFYILPFSYNFSPNKKNLKDLSKVDNLEVKFQFSFKINIIDKIFKDYLQLSFAYTNLSFWQLYNNSNSAPFRETNHEPDIFLVYRPSGQRKKIADNIFRLGIVHQSNGQNVPQSRSWNRVYVQGIFNMKFLISSLKIWHRIEENPKDTALSPAGDDNPGITNYMGNFELNLIKKLDKHTLSILFRNNLKKENNGAIGANWSFPLNENFKGYLQYFNGYGESLIDYNSPIQRASVGILIGDWI